MSNRAQRRRDTREFRHQVHRDHVLLTHLIDANADLSAHPMLHNIAMAWGAAIPQREPWCFGGCKASFAKTATPGAYLFAIPPGGADIASVSALCAECWRDLQDAEIERVAVRVLQQALPGGRFLDPR
jgi:hypothetical protein